MSKDAQHKIWCDEDEHHLFEHYAVFNEWLDGEDGQPLREAYGIDGLSQPSKAFFAGDKEAYDQAFKEYRRDCRHLALNEGYLTEQFGSDHWFERNISRFEQLINRIQDGAVVPFVGAGISVEGGFPSWADHLRQQGRTAGIDEEHIENLLAHGHYEVVLEDIEHRRGRDVFTSEIRDVFSRTGSIPEAIWRISELFTDTVITTNYDRLIEQAYDTGEKDVFQVINGMNALEKPIAGRVSIIKLHGDIRDPQRCILSKNQYDEAYGPAELDLERQIPKLLSYHYQNSSLLFLGCSLNNDRTVEVFRAVKEAMKDVLLPQHFSIEQVPEDEDELRDRNEALARIGITPIWFEKGCFDYVESMLQLAKNELQYHGSTTESVIPDVGEVDPTNNINLDLHLSSFLGDFVDLMPLLYWLHRHVPKEATNRYLSAMQRVFYADSFITVQTNENLLRGLDRLLRALSNEHRFDGYTHGKLSAAFSYIQQHLQSIGRENYADDAFEWNYHELFSISSHQLEELLATMDEGAGSDYQAIRLLIALLRHGQNQLHHQDEFCEMPGSVNTEFGDYLSFSMSSRLGVTVPDRLDEMYSDDVRAACQSAWENLDKPTSIGMMTYAKLVFSQLFSYSKR